MCKICELGLDTNSSNLGDLLYEHHISLQELKAHQKNCQPSTNNEAPVAVVPPKTKRKTHVLDYESKVKYMDRLVSATLREAFREAQEDGVPSPKTVQILINLDKIRPILSNELTNNNMPTSINIERVLIESDGSETKLP